MAGIDADTKLYAKFAEGPDEATTALDYSLSPHTLTFVGTAKLDDVNKLSAGGYSVDVTALLQDGNSDYVEVADSADWDIFDNLNNINSIEAWFKRANSSNHVMLNVEDSGSRRWQFYNQDGVGLRFIQDTGAELFLGGTVISDTNWHHVLVVIYGDGTYFQGGLYLDGTLIDSAVDEYNQIRAYSSPLNIGQDEQGSYVNGSLAHVRIQESDIFSAWTGSAFEATIAVPTGPYSAAASGGFTRMLLGVGK